MAAGSASPATVGLDLLESASGRPARNHPVRCVRAHHGVPTINAIARSGTAITLQVHRGTHVVLGKGGMVGAWMQKLVLENETLRGGRLVMVPAR